MALLLLNSGILLCASAQQDLASSFTWLEGTWKREDLPEGRTAYETWEMKSKQWSGMGISLKAGDTTFVEMLSIINKDSILYYVAEVKHNDAPTYFKITSVSTFGFVCENPAHDFPKRIEYIFEEQHLKVMISDGDKARSFLFRKI